MPDFGPPDWGLAKGAQKDVNATSFGDGYALRRPKGINHKRRIWSGLLWSNLSGEDALALYTFLEEKSELTPFNWVTPEEGTVRVTCRNPSLTQVDVEYTEVSVQFIEDFNP